MLSFFIFMVDSGFVFFGCFGFFCWLFCVFVGDCFGFCFLSWFFW